MLSKLDISQNLFANYLLIRHHCEILTFVNGLPDGILSGLTDWMVWIIVKGERMS